MPWVEREAGPGSKVIGQYANKQPGYAEEFLDPSHADLQPTFEDNRAAKIDAIQQNTRVLLAGGFSHASKQFSLSLEAQAKIIGLRVGILTGDIIDGPPDYPINVSAMDETDYEILNEADAKLYYKAALDRVKALVTAGSALKQSCLNAVNQTALDAIVDTRT